MYQNNSYQTQTGQVAPEAQNPQTGSVQPYQQQNISNFQAETQSLLEGQSGVSLVLPNGQSAIAPSGTTTITQVQQQSTSNYPIVVSGIVILVTLVVGILLMRYALKAEPVEPAIPEDNIEEMSDKKNITVVTSDDKPEKTPKKSAKTTKKKKRKKR